MIRIGIIGGIGSGKSYIAKAFGYPVFNADKEVADIYKKNKKVFAKLKRVLPGHINFFPINKHEIIEAILANKKNLKKIIEIIHLEVRKKDEFFFEEKQKQKNCNFGYSSSFRK